MISFVFLLLLAACSVDCDVTCQKEVARSYLDMAIDMISKAKNNIPTCDNCPKILKQKAFDCADVLQMGQNKSGVYEIFPMNRVTDGKRFYVYCDMETNGGGWTVIQRRGDFKSPKDYFNQDWKTYKEGFGKVERDFWLGNDNIYALTNQRRYSVRFDLKDSEQNKRFAVYKKFWIDGENLNYTLHISAYSGNAGDSMTYHNNQTFSTKDQNNTDRLKNCAANYKAGWWYQFQGSLNCYLANLNGLYKDKNDTTNGINWGSWKPHNESLQWAEIKIRPENFTVFLSSEVTPV